jgi:hypothetical protein
MSDERDHMTLFRYKAAIRKHIYLLGPSAALADCVGALDESGCPHLNYVLALAVVLDEMEDRHSRN